MSYSFGQESGCGPGEYFDEIVQECLCKPGYTPSPTVGSCVPVKTGGTTGADCLMKGMDFDITSQMCIPKCPPGYGRDIDGTCVFVSKTHGVMPPQGPPPPPPSGPPTGDAFMKASMPWVIGGAIGLVGLALLGGALGSKRKASENRRRRSRRNWL